MPRALVATTLLLLSECRGLALGGTARPTTAQPVSALPSSWWGPEAALVDLDLSAEDSTTVVDVRSLFLDECDLDSELEPSDDCVPPSMRIDQGQAPSHQPACVDDDSCHELIFFPHEGGVPGAGIG